MIPSTSVPVVSIALHSQDNTAMASHQQLASGNVKTGSRCTVASADIKQTLIYLHCRRRPTHVSHISVGAMCRDEVAWSEVNEYPRLHLAVVCGKKVTLARMSPSARSV